jgi:cell shape-determining protein MreC
MRLRRIDRYLLLLAGLFVIAILCPRDLPGEEILPGIYHAAVYRPFLAQAVAAGAEDELKVRRLESDLAAARLDIQKLVEQVEATRRLGRYFEELQWEAAPVAVPGWVFAVDADEFRHHLLVRCAQKKVQEGMPVVTGHALLGLVLRTTPQHAVVTCVDDPRFRIEVEVQTPKGPLACVAEGAGGGGIELLLVRTAGLLAKGQEVFTSSYDPKIPPGLLVGTIEEVEGEEGEGGPARVTVRPAASLSRLAQVEILGRR